ncbi:Baeyer-Villiger monooxygenase [Fulvia fulva]|uniref:Baeyer-Villiger monooxygenase n=1 Tax=Passalora fulva TaxID=5499 RepID=A0A9Q8P5N5_PASFU|nr:Baeyer-Villiger monooxygenase [Fulvia fulva]KAK4631636.1 Baeyer-Villiger monooxygenase [Fulvia fulva]KAK4633341.1 Baeyer-Villiger monooxygenase [Fulvia fulva]UJO14188.1 Baeyer-Villiger monooxygenase [Fulvia fulva]WPV10976.1 Baeyer-Villiger monooxygenase [Fulvia fulva]WPV25794.1 Baeyer-Villiger monooxygenase [Fulvia fulva]
MAASYLQQLLNGPFIFLFQLIQSVLDYLLSPTPPPPGAKLGRPKIAIIGAGLTGVSSASHCVGHGFDVQIFEAGSRKNLGGIWAKVNNTSGLQIHSVMYRFHPSVKWSEGYPDRKQIVGAIEKLWKQYNLQEKTKFDTRVEKVYKDRQGRWIINDESNGRFDGIIACVGTCGDPKMAQIKGQDQFKGKVFHSSELDGKEDDAKDKKVIVVGGGASAIEAMEFTTHAGAQKTFILARSEKWIIPRNPFIDVLLSLNIFGAETPFSWIPESLLRLFFYRDLKDIAPAISSGNGLFMETPMVNNDVLEQIRSGNASWLRGDIKGFTETGIKFNHRSQGVPKGGPGKEELIEGDMVIMATGYERPSLNFLPDECFEESYEPPNWYLQVFPPKHMDICANNCTYVNAIGTVGNYHIGIYTRFLLMFLVDPLARPTEKLMKTWIDFTRWVKQRAPTGAFDFFTYAELMYWFVLIILINPFRWKWALFVLCGVGAALPQSVVQQEDKIRDRFGIQTNGVREEGTEKLE